MAQEVEQQLATGSRELWIVALSPLYYLIAAVSVAMGCPGPDLLVTGFAAWVIVQVGISLRDASLIGGVTDRVRAITGLVISPLYLRQRPLLADAARTTLNWTWIGTAVTALVVGGLVSESQYQRDGAEFENILEEDFLDEYGRVADIDCPETIPTTPGTSFKCDVRTQDGLFTANVEVIDAASDRFSVVVGTQ